jgi:hypothetical protein
VRDTVHNTQIVEKVIEHPPERYIPKFYKWCTGILFFFIVIFLIYISVKSRL